jgi:hypothetical protein
MKEMTKVLRVNAQRSDRTGEIFRSEAKDINPDKGRAESLPAAHLKDVCHLLKDKHPNTVKRIVNAMNFSHDGNESVVHWDDFLRF